MKLDTKIGISGIIRFM